MFHTFLFQCVSLFTVCTATDSSKVLMRRAHLAAPNEYSKNAAEKPLVLYGIMTADQSMYQSKLKAQAETWAAKLIQDGRFFAASDGNISELKANAEQSYLVKSSCYEEAAGDLGQSCKEALLMETGLHRSADWLFRADDDSYVDTDALEKALGDFDTNEPAVLGILGCGEIPSENVGDSAKAGGIGKLCPEVAKHGGLCGGGGYALNRAALRALLQNGDSLQLKREYQSFRNHGIGFNDVAASCVLRKRGVAFHALNQLHGHRTFAVQAWQQLIDQRPFSYHSSTPEVMHWLHAKLNNGPLDEVKILEQKAFDHGCCCEFSEEQKKQCQEGTLAWASF